MAKTVKSDEKTEENPAENSENSGSSVESFAKQFLDGTSQGKTLYSAVVATLYGRPLATVAKAMGVRAADARRIKDQPEFQAAIESACREYVAHSMPAILDASIRSAMLPGAAGVQDRKMLLQMSGLYKPNATVQHDHSGEVHHRHNVVDRLAYAQSRRAQLVNEAASFDGQSVDHPGVGHDPVTLDHDDGRDPADSLDFD